jgi:hypothetical protein
MRAKRRDANHQAVADYLRGIGFSVLDLADHGDGVPDLAVGRAGFACLVEIKDGDKPPSARKLTDKEQRVRDLWTGPYVIALSPEDAARQLLAMVRAQWKEPTYEIRGTL